MGLLAVVIVMWCFVDGVVAVCWLVVCVCNACTWCLCSVFSTCLGVAGMTWVNSVVV